MSENIELIKNLCENWRREALGENGSIIIGKSEQFRLINNGIIMHDLNSNELQICCIELTRILLLKGMSTIISEDHKWFWSWIGEIINNRHINYLNDLNEYPIKELFCTCIRSTLAGIEKPPSNKEESLRRFEYKKEHPIEHNLNQLCTNSHLILAYLSFPLLESVLKKHCHEYVLLSGKVIKDFDVKRGTGYTKKYIIGDSINSIEDLLLLIIQKVGEETLVKNLNGILEHIKGLNEENPNEPCRIIYNWRNSSLHGETSYSTIGGTILNIAIIIFLHSIENEYNQNLSKIKENVSWNIQCNSQSPWIFYPPYF